MIGFVKDIENIAVQNDEFRRVVYTAKHCQLVVMALRPKEENSQPAGTWFKQRPVAKSFRDRSQGRAKLLLVQTCTDWDLKH